MAHQYEVETHDNKKRIADVPDHQHHSNFKDQALFISIVANLLGIAEHTIKGVKWLGKKAK